MQVGHVLGAAPIAAVQRIRADQVERARDRLPLPQRQHQQHPVGHALPQQGEEGAGQIDRKSTRLNSQSLMRISYAVFCLNKKIKSTYTSPTNPRDTTLTTSPTMTPSTQAR